MTWKTKVIGFLLSDGHVKGELPSSPRDPGRDHMINAITFSHAKGKRDLAGLIAVLREDVAQMPLRNTRDRVDQHMMMSILDVAEWKQRLGLFLDVRSMLYAAGVDRNYSCASLGRLSKVKSDQGGTRLIRMNARTHPRQSETYIINPAYPLVYSFRKPRAGRRLPRSAAGDPGLFGEWGAYMVPVMEDRREPVATCGTSLLDFFQAQQGDPELSILRTQEGLLIGRTNLGVHLTKPGVAVLLALGEEWLSYVQLSDVTGLSYSQVYRILRDKLAPLGLARSNIKDYMRQGGEKQLRRVYWKAGNPVRDFDQSRLPDVVGMRLRAVEKERELWARKHPTPAEKEKANAVCDW